jgi:hypothetical protein
LNKALHEAVEEGILICPISPSIYVELQKQNSLEKWKSYAQLMDQLSGKLSVRISQNIFVEEFRAILTGDQISREIAYSHYVDASSVSGLKFPEHGWDEAMTDEGTKLIFDEIEALPIAQSLSMTEKNRPQYMDPLGKGWRQLTEQEAKWREANKEVPSAEIEEAEFTSTVTSVLPQIFRVYMEGDDLTKLRMFSTSLQEKRELVKACPTFWNKYKVIAALRSNRSKLTENDMWDLEHVVSAVPYVDCLACDGGMRHLLTQMLSLDKKYRVKIVSTPDEILAWVNSLNSA